MAPLRWLSLSLALLLGVSVVQAVPAAAEVEGTAKREECMSTPEICGTMAAFGGSLVVPQVIPRFEVSLDQADLISLETEELRLSYQLPLTLPPRFPTSCYRHLLNQQPAGALHLYYDDRKIDVAGAQQLPPGRLATQPFVSCMVIDHRMIVILEHKLTDQMVILFAVNLTQPPLTGPPYILFMVSQIGRTCQRLDLTDFNYLALA